MVSKYHMRKVGNMKYHKMQDNKKTKQASDKPVHFTYNNIPIKNIFEINETFYKICI